MEGENVIFCNREIMGNMNLDEVDFGMICKLFVENIERNFVYGLDVFDIVVIEIVFFFDVLEIVG